MEPYGNVFLMTAAGMHPERCESEPQYDSDEWPVGFWEDSSEFQSPASSTHPVHFQLNSAPVDNVVFSIGITDTIDSTHASREDDMESDADQQFYSIWTQEHSNLKSATRYCIPARRDKGNLARSSPLHASANSGGEVDSFADATEQDSLKATLTSVHGSLSSLGLKLLGHESHPSEFLEYLQGIPHLRLTPDGAKAENWKVFSFRLKLAFGVVNINDV